MFLSPLGVAIGAPNDDDPIAEHVKAAFMDAAIAGELRDAEEWAQCLADLTDFRDLASIVAPLN